MFLRELRLKRFAKFVKEHGGGAALARECDGVDESYVSQLLSGHRPFGEVAARNMEKRCNLDEGYFDQVDDDRMAATEEEILMLAYLRSMSKSKREDMMKVGHALAEPDEERKASA